jgi:nitrate reductase assembly molybdenum cofactor insertion protein NarJ
MPYGYRSEGQVNSNGVFEFKDEFGSDPLIRRYGGDGDGSRALRQADIELSRVELDKAQKDLAAAQLPAKAMSDYFTNMNAAVTQRTAFEDTSRAQAQAAEAGERLSKATTAAELSAIQSEYTDAFTDKNFSNRFDGVNRSLRMKTLGGLATQFNAATRVEEINAAVASLPVELLADTDFGARVKSLADAATTRVNALRASQAASALSSAANQQAMMSAQQQYADVFDQPAVTTAAAANQKQLETEQRLRMSGLDPSNYAFRTGPDGDQMGFNFEAAEKALNEAPSADKIRQLEGSIGRLSARQKAAAGNELLDDGQPAVWGDNDQATLDFLTSQLDNQIRAFYKPKETSGAASNAAVDSFAGLLPQATVDRVNNQKAGAGTPTATATADTTTTSVTATPADEPQAAVATPEQAVAEPKVTFDPRDRARVAQLDLDAQRARDEAGLSAQPPVIRDINEALSAQYSGVRDKVQAADEAREQINPFEKSDTKSASDIQSALAVVYPVIGGEGFGSRFDVGSDTDPAVVSAAEFLSKVDPGFLRRIAASPGSNRAALTLDEIPKIAAKIKRQPRGSKRK